ncbi:MAG: hypothetical protein ACK5SV_05735 [Burkholderiales bacterium]
MYIVAIAWLYVVVMMALTETSIAAGLATLVFYGLAPVALLLWLMGTPQRRRARKAREAQDSRDAQQSQETAINRSVREPDQ